MPTNDNGSTPQFLTKDAIRQAPDIREIDLDVPEWGGPVKIRTFSAKQAREMRALSTGFNPATKKVEVDNDELEARLVTSGIVEPHLELEDYAWLQEKSMAALARVLRAINDASGLSEMAVTEADKSVRPRSDDAV